MERPKRMARIYFFGGYRQDSLPAGNHALAALATAIQPTKLRVNLWSGCSSDTLLARWQRSTAWIDDFVIPSAERADDDEQEKEDIVVAGYSMGAHLALRFAVELMERPKGAEPLKKVYLFAPDPKSRECRMDHGDKARHEKSAYEEAQEFWQLLGPPGAMFIAKVRFLAQQIGGGSVFAVYSKDDEVAEWDGNVSELVELGRLLINCVEASTTKPITFGDNLQVMLNPSAARSEIWIHDQLFEMVSAQRRGEDTEPGAEAAEPTETR